MRKEFSQWQQMEYGGIRREGIGDFGQKVREISSRGVLETQEIYPDLTYRSIRNRLSSPDGLGRISSLVTFVIELDSQRRAAIAIAHDQRTPGSLIVRMLTTPILLKEGHSPFEPQEEDSLVNLYYEEGRNSSVASLSPEKAVHVVGGMADIPDVIDWEDQLPGIARLLVDTENEGIAGVGRTFEEMTANSLEELQESADPDTVEAVRQRAVMAMSRLSDYLNQTEAIETSTNLRQIGFEQSMVLALLSQIVENGKTVEEVMGLPDDEIIKESLDNLLIVHNGYYGDRQIIQQGMNIVMFEDESFVWTQYDRERGLGLQENVNTPHYVRSSYYKTVVRTGEQEWRELTREEKLLEAIFGSVPDSVDIPNPINIGEHTFTVEPDLEEQDKQDSDYKVSITCSQRDKLGRNQNVWTATFNPKARVKEIIQIMNDPDADPRPLRDRLSLDFRVV